MTDVVNYVDENQDTSEEDINTNEENTELSKETETVEEIPQTEEADFLGMSDEDFLKAQEPVVEEVPAVQENNVSEQETSITEQSEQKRKQTSVEQVVEAVNTPLTDEDFRKAVTAEFVANGRQVQITDPKDIIQLMQKGMNYNKKMEAIKPVSGLVRTLKQHGIDTPEQLQFLLDLQKGDKAAIAKLLKDQEIDTYSLPDLEESPYVPQAKVVSNKQADFEDVLADIRTMDKGTELLQSLGSSIWDDTSLQFMQENPEAVYLLYEDKQKGVYDAVMKTIDVDNALGRITPEWKQKPFVELYEFVATQLQQGQQASKETTQQNQSVQQPVVQKPKVVGHNLQPQVKTQQPSAPKTAGVNHVNSAPQNFTEVPDFLSMTDDQFEAFTKSSAGIRFNG